MDNRDSRSAADRMIGACCFVGAAVFASLGIWLCINGDFPAIKTGDHSFMMFGGMTINGVEVPDWAFYFIPAGLFIIAITLSFIGWRKHLANGRVNI
jgi:hypothetical protein